MKDWVFKSKNGTEIGILELGDLASETVVFYIHGFPGCRKEAFAALKVAQKYHIRLIAIDRAGYGNSTFIKDRKVIDFPATITEIADALEIKTFSILGVSGGASYTAACAKFIPNRLDKVYIVSGVSPLDGAAVFDGMIFINKLFLKAGRIFPKCTTAIVYVVASLWKNSSTLMFYWLKTFMSKGDKDLLESKMKKDTSVATPINEGLKNGVRGAAKDFELLCREWGFALDSIEIPVSIWHGEDDCYVPIAMGRYNAEKIPRSKFKAIPEGGHLMVFDVLDEIFQEIAPDNRY